MLTATAVCRRSSSIKVRISINNLRGSWLFRSRISLRHPFTMFTGSFVTSWILGSNAPDGLEANFPVPSWVCPPVICAKGCCTIAGDAMKEFGLIPHRDQPLWPAAKKFVAKTADCAGFWRTQANRKSCAVYNSECSNVPYMVLSARYGAHEVKSGLKRIEVIFFRTAAGGEPVRD